MRLSHIRRIILRYRLFTVYVVAASGDENLYKLWKNRLEQIVHEFSGFEWGMENFIVDEFYSIPWIEED